MLLNKVVFKLKTKMRTSLDKLKLIEILFGNLLKTR